jgi:serine/threonine protein kinase/tetratricopeptide (TPR) repeat protein
MSEPGRCEKCGNALTSGGALAGQCPRCLLEIGLQRDEASGSRLAPGAQLGPYQILDSLGAGGMGEVYRAKDTRLNRTVAIKLVRSELAGRADLRHRFQREAQALAQLNHPNICTIHDVGPDFLVMEWLQGQTLKEKITGGPLPLNEALDIVLQVGRGLEAAHERGILHRDIKPANIMVTPHGQTKVMDFGLAKFREAAAEGEITVTLGMTETGTTMGTPPYMSPEQARGESTDQRADIWSLGVVLYEILSGRRPFQGSSGLVVMRSILDDQPEPLSALRESLPAELDRISAKALKKDPAERYQSAGELVTDLQAVRDGKASQGGQQTSYSAAKTDVRDPKRAFQISLILGMAAGLLALVLLTWMRSTRPSPSTVPRVEALAVLPLANLSGDAAQEYFADGMTDALINDLAQIGTLRVISRTSVMQFKGTTKLLPEIARQLRVDAVVEGSMLRSGNRVRITAELIQASTDRHLWAATYERDMGDVLDLQNEVALAIVREIQAKLTPEEQGRLSRSRAVNPVAYEAYLKGRISWEKYTEEGLTQSIEYFEQAIKEDPGYAAAYAGLSISWASLQYIGAALPEDAHPRASEAARKALALDDSVAEAHAAMGMVLSAGEWNWVAGEQESKNAIRLNPGYTPARVSYSNQLRHRGRTEESVAEAKHAQELDPLSALANEVVANAYKDARQYDLAIEYYQKAIQLEPNRSVAHNLLGWAYFYNGMHDKSIEEIKKDLALDGIDAGLSPDLAFIYSALGRKDEAQKILQRLLALSKQAPVQPGYIALTYIAVGKNDLAMVWLEKAYEQHSQMMTWLKVDPRFDTLRADPRFQDMMRRVGLI